MLGLDGRIASQVGERCNPGLRRSETVLYFRKSRWDVSSNICNQEEMAEGVECEPGALKAPASAEVKFRGTVSALLEPEANGEGTGPVLHGSFQDRCVRRDRVRRAERPASFQGQQKLSDINVYAGAHRNAEQGILDIDEVGYVAVIVNLESADGASKNEGSDGTQGNAKLYENRNLEVINMEIGGTLLGIEQFRLNHEKAQQPHPEEESGYEPCIGIAKGRDVTVPLIIDVDTPLGTEVERTLFARVGC